MTTKAIKTKASDGNRPIMVEVCGDRIEMWRMGERTRRSVAIEDIWRDAVAMDAPRYPVTSRSSRSIIAYFVRVGKTNSYWMRMDTGEELTEAQLRKAGRLEKRPVLTLFGQPSQAHMRKREKKEAAAGGVQ